MPFGDVDAILEITGNKQGNSMVYIHTSRYEANGVGNITAIFDFRKELQICLSR